MANLIYVEVAYARVDKQTIKEVTVATGATIRQVVDESGILSEFPEIDLDKNRVGIFSEKKNLQDIVEEGDRIEIYRALLISAKEARRKRATASAKGTLTKQK